jgi:hypothetical protein
MPIIARFKGGNHGKLSLAEGEYVATLTEVEDIGLQPNPFETDKNGNPLLREQVILTFSVEDENGQRHPIKSWFTLSLNPKANLFKVVKALTGTAPDEDIDLNSLIGIECRVDVEYRLGKDGKNWPRITGYRPLRTQQRETA